ncbi:MAG: tetratricopeptide repeat protein, partial [Rhizobacter sp.]
MSLAEHRAAKLRRLGAIGLLALAPLLLVAGCQEAKPTLLAMPAADTSVYEPSVQAAIARARQNLDRVAASQPTNQQLADAYAELAMTYHAQDLTQPAEVAYKNARLLAPRDKRWAYLLGHLYNDTARQAEAIEAFEATLAIDRDDAPALFSLGEVYLQHGDFDKAQRLFERLVNDKDARAAALAGLGKVAMAKRDYKVAIERFEEALKLWPSAAKLRSPLATAYQATGNKAKAEEVLRDYSAAGAEPTLPDPMADELGRRVASSRALLRRGQRFGQSGRFDLAAEAFQAAVAANPKDAEALANLGISLANLGQLEKAQRVLTDSLAIDDANAVAQLSLAVILDRQGLDADAVAHYRAALKSDPKNVQALTYLADAQMRTGHFDEAARLYRETMAVGPSSRIRTSLALAEVRLGRYREARAELEAGLEQDPGSHTFSNALARILAAAPDDSVRDGERALRIAKPLFETTRSPDVGQTYAMAMAATGDFEHA